MRTDAEVVDVLRTIYRAEFGGKSNQRFRISWADLRILYGLSRLHETRFYNLAEIASRRNLFLVDLGDNEEGHFVAVVKGNTMDRWRRVPNRLIDIHRAELESNDEDIDGE